MFFYGKKITPTISKGLRVLILSLLSDYKILIKVDIPAGPLKFIEVFTCGDDR